MQRKLADAGISLWETGLKHGTLTFRYQKNAYEITTFRRDGPYEDFRRPQWVEFTSSLREDLARRDFTINAMAWHWRDGLADPFGGAADMEARVIRAVGAAEDRLQEDALRIMRGIRFAGSLDFVLESGLASAMTEKAALLGRISLERLASELQAMLMLPSPRRALALLAEMGIWPYLAPEMAATVGFDQSSKHHHLNVYEHMAQTAENAPPMLAVRLAALFHDVAKPAVFTLDENGKGHFRRHEIEGAKMASGMMDRLRFSHAVRDRAVMLIRFHMLHLKKLTDADLRKAISELPKPRADSLEEMLCLQKADLMASRHTAQSLEDFGRFAERCRGVLADGCPLDVADLAIRGAELEGLGLAPADRGKAQRAMLEEVLRDPGQNRRPALLAIVEQFRSG